MESRKSAPLPSRAAFLIRFARGAAVGGGIVAVALGAGVLGYHEAAGLAWIDALLNAAMILTGMGPVDALTTTRGKLFATCYALFSGIVFLSVGAVVFAPVVQRFLHRFHLELWDGAASQAAAGVSGTARNPRQGGARRRQKSVLADTGVTPAGTSSARRRPSRRRRRRLGVRGAIPVG